MIKFLIYVKHFKGFQFTSDENNERKHRSLFKDVESKRSQDRERFRFVRDLQESQKVFEYS